MPAERMFLTKERVIRDGVLVHGVNQRIPASQVQELGLSDLQVEPASVGRGSRPAPRLRRLPDFMTQTAAAETEEAFDELPPPSPKPLIREKPQRRAPRQPSQQRVRRVPDTAKRGSETNQKPSEDRT